MKRASADAYATMTLSIATTAMNRPWVTKVTKNFKGELTELSRSTRTSTCWIERLKS